MNTFLNNNFKDSKPLDTINKIRGILCSHGINPIESSWKSSGQNYHSVYLRVPNINIFSNGKGVSYELALASAYGEFIERLQNQSMYRFNVDFSDYVESYNSFFYAPDEKYYDKSYISAYNDNNELFIPNTFSEILNEKIIEKWKNFSDKSSKDKILTIPYYDVVNKKLIYVPVPITSLIYSTNGMCAGNSQSEALVEGICEIFERYSTLSILEKDIVPPTIPKSFLKNYHKQYNMINYLEKCTSYEVIVKDCSLNIGLPVVGIIIIDKVNQKYIWSFGSNPNFEIALERTLTEALQGCTVSDFNRLVDFSYKQNKSLNSKKNKLEILRSGQGVFNTKTFSCDYSYEFKPFEKTSFNSNKEMLTYLLNIIDKMGKKIFIRDVSFMKFPAYHIIIPGISEALTGNDPFVKRMINELEIRPLLRNLNNCNNNDIKKILNHVETYLNDNEDSLGDIVGAPVNNTFPWYSISTDLFCSTAYWKLGDLKKSYQFICKFLDKNSNINLIDKDTLTWYKCIRDYLGSKLSNTPLEESKYILNIFYNKDLIEEVIEYIDNPKEIFKNYSNLNCWDCNNCNFTNYCNYKNLEKLHLTIKEAYRKNPINQKDLRKFFDTI